MSKKDILLLKILGVILLLVVPNFFITYNVIKEIPKQSVVLVDLEKKYEAYETITANKPILDAKLKELTAKLETLVPNTAEISKAYDAHYLFTKFAKANNLDLSSLSLSELSIVPDVTYDPLDMEQFGNTALGIDINALQEQPKTEIAEDSANAPVVEPKTIENSISVYQLSINYTVSGQISDMLSLADDVSNYSDYMVISNLAIPDMQSTEKITTTTTVTVYLTAKTSENTEEVK